VDRIVTAIPVAAATRSKRRPTTRRGTRRRRGIMARQYGIGSHAANEAMEGD